MIHRLHTTCLLLMAFLTTGSVLAENRPCFRGPTRQGISTEQELPRHWDAEQGIKWKVEIPGTGWSSPIVWEDYVVLTTATDGGASSTSWPWSGTPAACCGIGKCCHRPWRKEERNSYASATPATDGEFVVAACADRKSGRPWISRDRSIGPIGTFPFYSRHGLATSPVRGRTS